MITKKEAKEMLIMLEAETIIDEIYESRGSCGKCSFWSGQCGNPSIKSQVDYGVTRTSEDWYCADFERKTNDNEITK